MQDTAAPPLHRYELLIVANYVELTLLEACNSAAGVTSTVSCDHQHDLFQTHFQCPKQNPRTSTRDSLPPCLALGTSALLSPLLGISLEWSQTGLVLLCLASVTLAPRPREFIHVTACIRP